MPLLCSYVHITDAGQKLPKCHRYAGELGNQNGYRRPDVIGIGAFRWTNTDGVAYYNRLKEDGKLRHVQMMLQTRTGPYCRLAFPGGGRRMCGGGRKSYDPGRGLRLFSNSMYCLFVFLINLPPFVTSSLAPITYTLAGTGATNCGCCTCMLHTVPAYCACILHLRSADCTCMLHTVPACYILHLHTDLCAPAPAPGLCAPAHCTCTQLRHIQMMLQTRSPMMLRHIQMMLPSTLPNFSFPSRLRAQGSALFVRP